MTSNPTKEQNRRISELSVAPQPDAEQLAALNDATRQLIAAMKADGHLLENPMALAMERTVTLHREAAAERLTGKRILVTGGSGCVGTRLRTLLADFEPAALINLDIAAQADGPGTWLEADIRNPASLDAAFASARPEVVFHLAGIRAPGRAEAEVNNAVETNVFGTGHVIEACRRHRVPIAVYSSTGKCFAYVTDHVYTGTKKLAEMQWVRAAREDGPTVFAMTRFTHVMENGLVMEDIQNGIDAGLVSLHGPDRYFNVQNLRQATHLLVNAVALAGHQAPGSFWSAADLGWPVNTLELALFEMERREVAAAVRFSGVPKGYDEHFFRGQFDWSGDYDVHPLINALETPSTFTDSTGTMVGAAVQPCSNVLLDRELAGLRRIVDGVAGPGAREVKPALLKVVEHVTGGIFAGNRPLRLLDLLWWGVAPAGGGNKDLPPQFKRIVALLCDALLQPASVRKLAEDEGAADKLADIVAALASSSGLQTYARRLQAIRPQAPLADPGMLGDGRGPEATPKASRIH